MPEIHAHDVMDLMQRSGRTFTRASFIALLGECYGAGARYQTCSVAGLTADELLAFLAQRGKLTGDESAFRLQPCRVCAH